MVKLRWLLPGLLVTLLLVPAGAITAARLLDLPGGAWVRLVSFTPYALVLYAAALVLMVPALVWGRGFWRGTARVAAVLALVGAALHAYWASGPYFGTSPAEARTGDRLHVMTANLLKGRADTSRLVEVALADRVDVLVLEEATPRALDRLRAVGVRTAFAHSAGRAEPGPSGTVVLSRYPLRRVRPLATGFGSYEMDVLAPGGRLHLLAVHPRPPVGDVKAWRLDHGVIRHAARAAGDRTMIVGDLNATMDHLPMRALVANGYDDAATQATSQWQPTWPSAGEVSRLGVALPPLLAIDHVLVRSGLRALRTDSVTIEGTDHRALVAVVAR